MEKKYGVIVCSNAATDYIQEASDIRVFRSVIIFGQDEYNDYVDLKAEDFYNRCATDKQAFPKTAYVSRGVMLETFEEMKNEGYDGALVITISSGLSGLYNAVCSIAEEVEDFDVKAYDSKTLSYPEAYMAIEANRMLKEGKSLEDVYKRLDYIRDHNHMVFAVETLEYLIKNGRLSRASGAVANLLKIRPMLHISKEGKVESLAKARTSKKARALMIDKFLEEVQGKNVEAFLINTNNDEAVAEAFATLNAAGFNTSGMAVHMLTPVVGAHAGPGTIGIGYIEIENEGR